ncbi:gibberellin-regulated protein 3-like [Typha latifolia]|uniref:gibberellin-regulated protein 3-like n=1 Tax=Typha latifolia TaxID=4733 RepID=UPI003C2DBABA
MMALRLLFFTVVLLCILAKDSFHEVVVVDAHLLDARYGNGKPAPVLDCPGRCGERCSKHSRPNVCMRACGTCCYRCKCVPPGTSGNRHVCGACYTTMTTHGNRSKCP